MMTDEQFAKLPKWAQAEFKRLRMELTDKERVIERILGAAESPIKVRQKALDDSTTQHIIAPYGVDFELDERTTIVVRRKENTYDPGFHLEVSAVGANAQLTIQPSVSNVIRIGAR